MPSYMDYVNQGMDPSQAAYRARMDQMGVGPSILPGLANINSNMQQAVMNGGGTQKTLDTYTNLAQGSGSDRYVDSLAGIRQQPGLTYHALGPNGTAAMGYNASLNPITPRDPNNYNFNSMLQGFNVDPPNTQGGGGGTPYAVDPGNSGIVGGYRRPMPAGTPYAMTGKVPPTPVQTEPLQFDNSDNLSTLFPQVNYANDQSTNRGSRYFQQNKTY